MSLFPLSPSRPHGFTAIALPVLAIGMLVAAGCTTKSYVRQQTTPLVNHINQLDAQTAQNSNQIKQVDQQTQQGISQANQASQAAMDQANQVQSQAQQVGQQLGQTSTKIQALDNTVANLDDYKQVSQDTVHFALNKADLTPEDQQTLDATISKIQQDTHGIIEVKGYTDITGPVAFNNKLSQQRADSVVRYLEAHDIAPHRIFLIGLGINNPAAPNTTLSGRKENRRVEVTLLTNNLSSGSSQ